MFAFGTRHPDKRGRYEVVLLKDCLKFLQKRALEHYRLAAAVAIGSDHTGVRHSMVLCALLHDVSGMAGHDQHAIARFGGGQPGCLAATR